MKRRGRAQVPPNYNRIPEIGQVPEDLNGLVLFLNDLIRQLNEVLRELGVSDSEFRGNDGFTPSFNNDVDLNEFRLRNISRSQRAGDAVTRRELEEIGILGSAFGVVFNRPVTFNSNLFAEGPQGGGGGELATNADVTTQIDNALEGLIPVAVEGQFLDAATPFAVGDDGQPVMARNERGGARFIQMRGEDVLTHDNQVCALLVLILQELRSIRYGGDHT